MILPEMEKRLLNNDVPTVCPMKHWFLMKIVTGFHLIERPWRLRTKREAKYRRFNLTRLVCDRYHSLNLLRLHLIYRLLILCSIDFANRRDRRREISGTDYSFLPHCFWVRQGSWFCTVVEPPNSLKIKRSDIGLTCRQSCIRYMRCRNDTVHSNWFLSKIYVIHHGYKSRYFVRARARARR